MENMRTNWDHIRTGVLLEPRGSEVLVGAVLTPPVEPDSVAGVIFFNNASYLGMCGHGTIGVIETLKFLGEIGPGIHQIDSPVGTVQAELLANGEVAIQNVPARRHRHRVSVDVEGFGQVCGDVAYGGNWFFIVHPSPLELTLKQEAKLKAFCRAVKSALILEGITGAGGAEIDHIELSASATEADSVNYVLCPGDAYDRSPCGTGTSAKLACLFESGELKPGEWYVQQSITGSQFKGKVEIVNGEIIPTIVGRAWITAESQLIFADDDPLRWGLV
jgi:4-hydroxyproline epimerase